MILTSRCRRTNAASRGSRLKLTVVRRIGVAYARRYALFALVGIAGEDDLDAPDLSAPQDPEPANPPVPNGRSEPRVHVATGHANGSRGRRHPPAPKLLLQPDASAVLREQLLIELAAMATADEAAAWAQRKLPAKNTLTPDDADVIEQAFRAKLQSLEPRGTDEAASTTASATRRAGVVSGALKSSCSRSMQFVVRTLTTATCGSSFDSIRTQFL